MSVLRSIVGSSPLPKFLRSSVDNIKVLISAIRGAAVDSPTRATPIGGNRPAAVAPGNQSVTALLVYHLNLVTLLMEASPATAPGLLFKSEVAMEEFVVKMVAHATNPRY